MPTNLVRAGRDERLWERAKQLVRTQYHLTEADGHHFYRLVNAIYRRAKGVKKGFLLSFRKSRNQWEDQPRSTEKGKEGQFARRYARLLGTVDPRKKSELVKTPLTVKNRHCGIMGGELPADRHQPTMLAMARERFAATPIDAGNGILVFDTVGNEGVVERAIETLHRLPPGHTVGVVVHITALEMGRNADAIYSVTQDVVHIPGDGLADMLDTRGNVAHEIGHRVRHMAEALQPTILTECNSVIRSMVQTPIRHVHGQWQDMMAAEAIRRALFSVSEMIDEGLIQTEEEAAYRLYGEAFAELYDIADFAHSINMAPGPSVARSVGRFWDERLVKSRGTQHRSGGRVCHSPRPAGESDSAGRERRGSLVRYHSKGVERPAEPSDAGAERNLAQRRGFGLAFPVAKSTVKAHSRRLPSGKTVQVREHRRKGDKHERPAAGHDPVADYQANGTRSRAFKAWFGDWEHDPQHASKVVDPETGEPIAVHHGTPSGGFDAFQHKGMRDSGYWGAGFYFSASRDVAETFTAQRMATPAKGGKQQVYAVYLNIRNPFTSAHTTPDEMRRLVDLARAEKGLPPIGDEKWAGSARYIEDAHRKWGDNEVGLSSDLGTLLGDVARLAALGGYDGIIMKDVEGGTYVAFRPEQIKAVANAGTFDPAEASIYKGLRSPLLMVFRKSRPTQKVNVKTRALRQKTGKVVVQPAHTETRKKAASVEPVTKLRNTAGLSPEQMALIHSLIASGQLEVGKSGSSYVVRSKPEGKTKWSRVGEFSSQGDALQAIASKVLVGVQLPPPPRSANAEVKPPAAPERPAEWELQGYKLKIVGNKVHVITPYDEKIISAAKSRGGRWDRDRKAWVIPFEKYESMRAMIEKHLGAKAEHDKAAKERAKQEAGERRAAEQAAREAHDKANRDTPAEEWARGPFRITVYPTTVSLRSPKNYDMIAEIKKIPGASWSNNVWTVDRSHYARLREIAERYSADFVVPANAQPWQSGSYKLSIYKSRVGLLSPYNTELIARVKRIPGAEWFPQEKEWRVPGAQYDALRAVAEEFAAKDAGAKQEKAAKDAETKKMQAEDERSQGIVSFGHMGPETARRSDFAQVGDIVKHDGNWVVITQAKYNLGLGEDFSFASFKARPATEEEAKPYMESEERRAKREIAEAKRTELAARITAEGKQPTELTVPEGARYSDRQNAYGGGDWFVVGPEHIWYVLNNGMDGDNWARNNVRTGGAGAIGWCVPRTDELVAEIEALVEVTNERKSLTAAGRSLKRLANREPINTDDAPIRKGLWLSFSNPDSNKAATHRITSRMRKSVVSAKTQVRDGKVVHVRGYTDRRSKAVAKVVTPKGNVQYQYDEETLAAAKAEKFRRVAHLAKRLPEILEGMKADLAQGDTPQSKVAAAVVALIDRCCFRIGTDEYAEKHGTYGVTTLRPEHVTVDGATIRFQFTGKKQVPWDTATTDPDLADFIAHLASDAPGDRLFWYHRDGRQYPIRANHVNDWLRDYGVSAKDFRTYHATRLCFEELKRLSSRQPLAKKEIKQRVKQAVAATAERLGHTPAVCRQSYILPAVIDDFEANGGRLSIDPWKTARNMGKSFLLAFGGNAQ